MDANEPKVLSPKKSKKVILTDREHEPKQLRHNESKPVLP